MISEDADEAAHVVGEDPAPKAERGSNEAWLEATTIQSLDR